MESVQIVRGSNSLPELGTGIEVSLVVGRSQPNPLWVNDQWRWSLGLSCFGGLVLPPFLCSVAMTAASFPAISDSSVFAGSETSFPLTVP